MYAHAFNAMRSPLMLLDLNTILLTTYIIDMKLRRCVYYLSLGKRNCIYLGVPAVLFYKLTILQYNKREHLTIIAVPLECQENNNNNEKKKTYL